MRKKVLGKGLSALIPDFGGALEEGILEIETHRIIPNRYQPRVIYEQDKIEELARSIKENGIIQPLIVRKEADAYEIIAGERRWRAAQKAGLQKVPVVVKSVSDDKIIEMALVENIQREDLNPIEIARSYNILLKEYALKQEEIAGRVGKERSSVANYLRLLSLSSDVQEALKKGKLEMGHARAIAGLKEPAKQGRVLREVTRRGLSVRDTENLVKRVKEGGKKKEKSIDPDVVAAQDDLMGILGAKVSIKGKSRGKIEIHFKSEEELDRLYALLLSLK